MQLSLDGEDFVVAVENLELPDARMQLFSGLFSHEEAANYLSHFITRIPWQQDYLFIAGKKIKVPRLQAWYGAAYAYSGLKLKAEANWPGELLNLKKRVESHTSQTFNSVLLNYYRDGQDSVAWHSDDEKELGPDPVIASVSFGCSRRFELKHKRTKQKLSCELKHGSVLLMGKGVQRYWLHQIPKQAALSCPRINLTFRQIVSP